MATQQTPAAPQSLREKLNHVLETEFSSLPTASEVLSELHAKVEEIESKLSLEHLKEKIEEEVDNAFGDIRNTVNSTVNELKSRVERMEALFPRGGQVGKVQAMPSPTPPPTTTSPESGTASQQTGSTEESAGQKEPTGT